MLKQGGNKQGVEFIYLFFIKAEWGTGTYLCMYVIPDGMWILYNGTPNTFVGASEFLFS